MKKLFTISFFALSISASAQKLPDTCRLKLTAHQVIAISAKLDSIQSLLINTSNAPSAQVSAFNQRLNLVFAPVWEQIKKQLIVEKAKIEKK